MSKKPCSVEGCGKTRVAKGLCSACYREKYGKSYKPKKHRPHKELRAEGVFDLTKKPTNTVIDGIKMIAGSTKPKKTRDDKIVSYMTTIGRLSDRCDELNSENIKLKQDLEIIENNYADRFNEMEIEQLRIKANAWDLLFTILTTTKGGRNG